MKKAFLISIDTEGDDLWNWRNGAEIRTENARYLERFQVLCEKYGFVPTYLTNYEMAMDPVYVDFAEKTLSHNACEIGMHLHAWNNPPIFELRDINDNGGQPYLIEYPEEIIEEKIGVITKILRERFGEVITHRAGRWATNSTYFKILDMYGYKVDCSVTPGISWKNNVGATTGSEGSDYTGSSRTPYKIEGTGIIEIPMSIVETHRYIEPDQMSIKKFTKSLFHAIRGQRVWIRPLPGRFNEMIEGLQEIKADEDAEYAMFMIHSSELMPGGSRAFKTVEEIDNLYLWIEKLFKTASSSFVGETIGKYGKNIQLQMER